MKPLIPVGRADRSPLASWFWTIDRPLVCLLIILMAVGVIAVAAASPAAARRLSDASFHLEPLHFLERQMIWALLSLPLMLAVSMLSPQGARRFALAGFAVSLALLCLVPQFGMAKNGAVRWLAIGGFQLQPVEFLKPCFVVAMALLMSLKFDDRGLPVIAVGAMALVAVLALLVIQPDFGQAALITAIWLVLATLSGLPLVAVGGVAAAGAAGIALGYRFEPHVRNRIDGFLHGEGDTYQVDRALDCFRSGGMFGTGPGEGVAKFRLPEAHTDYIFAVIGEEFGAMACFALALLYLAIVLRVLLQLLDEKDPFTMLAATGLVTLFGGQALINMAVNVALAPAKGMTLPFISHGGSSFLATAIGMGLLLSLTRRNRHLKASPYLGLGAHPA
jgi:cell division protein FtsW